MDLQRKVYLYYADYADYCSMHDVTFALISISFTIFFLFTSTLRVYVPNYNTILLYTIGDNLNYLIHSLIDVLSILFPALHHTHVHQSLHHYSHAIPSYTPSQRRTNSAHTRPGACDFESLWRYHTGSRQTEPDWQDVPHRPASQTASWDAHWLQGSPTRNGLWLMKLPLKQTQNDIQDDSFLGVNRASFLFLKRSAWLLIDRSAYPLYQLLNNQTNFMSLPLFFNFMTN